MPETVWIFVLEPCSCENINVLWLVLNPGWEIRTWKQFAVFLGAKRVSQSSPSTEQSFNWRALGGRSPWVILQTWTLSTLGYCFSDAWKRIVSKAVIVKTNEDRKLLLFYLIFEGGGARLYFLFACLVNYFTVLNCSGWNYM